MKALMNALQGKSATINFNALYAAIVAVIQALGYQLSPELVASGQALMNVVLRAITTKPLSEK